LDAKNITKAFMEGNSDSFDHSIDLHAFEEE